MQIFRLDASVSETCTSYSNFWLEIASATMELQIRHLR
jgi:hypothetical protein